MRRLLPLLFLVVLASSACQVRTKVDLTANANGSGSVAVEVRLDAEAAAAVPNLATQLRTGDLKTTGWVIDGPTKASNGETVVKVSHTFDNPGQADAVLTQLSGTSGPLRNFHLTQSRSFAHSHTKFSGTVDLTEGINSFGDGVLTARVGSPLGFDPNEVQNALGMDWEKSFPVDVEVHLPGAKWQHIPPTTPDGQWHVRYGVATNLVAEASGTNATPVVFSALAALALLIALGIGLFWKTYRPQHMAKGAGVRARDLLAAEESKE